MNQTITLTFSESVENHTGMQIIGQKRTHGISPEKCIELFDKYECAELHYLNKLLGNELDSEVRAEPLREPRDDAYFLILRNGLKNIFNIDHEEMYKEQLTLTPDKKAYMYGRVVDKKARYNLCYSDEYQPPNYKKKQGTVIPFSQLPIMNDFRNKLSILGDEFKDLYAEGNFYYDVNKCYIGYHGDTERKVVLGVRLNKEFPIHFKWFHRGEETNLKTTIDLQAGDIYIMSEKTTGNDWKRKSVEWTLRHAAGLKI
jgi:hypothetical protein